MYSTDDKLKQENGSIVFFFGNATSYQKLLRNMITNKKLIFLSTNTTFRKL